MRRLLLLLGRHVGRVNLHLGERYAELSSAVQTPLKAALMTYVGVAGLAGVAVVVGIMVSPAREAVQEAIQPVLETLPQINIPSPLVMPPITSSAAPTVAGPSAIQLRRSDPLEPSPQAPPSVEDVAPSAAAQTLAPAPVDNPSTALVVPPPSGPVEPVAPAPVAVEDEPAPQDAVPPAAEPADEAPVAAPAPDRASPPTPPFRGASVAGAGRSGSCREYRHADPAASADAYSPASGCTREA